MDSDGIKTETSESRRDSDTETQEPSSSSVPVKKATVKKRTKTGCLTCRRRRIKCDEGKPRCNNCIKSKRQCDGYNQRVIFKDPMGTYRANHMGPIIFDNSQAHHHPMLMHPQMVSAVAHGPPSSQGALPFIAPRPPLVNDLPPGIPMQHMQQHLPMPGTQGLPLHPDELLQHGQPIHQGSASPLHQYPQGIPLDLHSLGQPWQHQMPESAGLDEYQPPNLLSPLAFDISPVAAQGAPVPAVGDPVQWQGDGALGNGIPVQPSQQFVPAPSFTDTEAQMLARRQVLSEEDAYWYSDDDASMGESDDDEESEDEAQHLEQNDLGIIVAGRLHSRPRDVFGTQMRTFSNFADANVLATYVPSSMNSPLNDAQTAAVFWYFVNVTAPIMSLFERRMAECNNGESICLAVSGSGCGHGHRRRIDRAALLQAMLALGSLHMAKIQGVPHTASMKHYHLSLRRVARNYESPSRRVQPATLAATVLLGFYEVWNSDHDKWCKHMWGARTIMKEMPLRDMTRRIIALKREERKRLEALALGYNDPLYADTIVAYRDIDQVDSAFLAQLAGQPVAYDSDEPPVTAGKASAPGPAPSWIAPDHYTPKDIETYELISDVLWWYSKMDVYQSILGGTPLLMEYDHWTHCAPRSPMGKIDAIYGTYDHLMVLLARLCHFTTKDLARKRKAKKPDGQQAPQGQSPPGFAGMMPSTGHITIPKGFSPPRETSPHSDGHEEADFEVSTANALQEWENIRQTFELYRSKLGPDFEPLGPEYEPPVSSPFGTTLKYRTYSIASIWMNYYMGMIALYRAHPSMPPIAMSAAGMAARQTAPYANQVGRIIAGLTNEDLSTMAQASTILGSVCIESSFPMFVAAIQYQDTAQRHWTVRRMHNVGRLTGWQSARQIARGCELGWIKAASMGRGPPYESPPDLEDVPLSIWSRPRRIIDRIRELEEVEERLILSSSERPQYAVGLLGVETDMGKLELNDNE